LLCELPKKRGRAEVSAFPSWQHGATGRHDTLKTIDLTFVVAGADGARILRRSRGSLHLSNNKSENTMICRHVFGLSLIAALGLVWLPSGALAQQKSLKEQLVGTWTAVSWEQVNKDGSKLLRFGANPKGVNVFDANGRFFVMFARPDLPKIASRDPSRTTPEESKAIVEGTIAYFGTYSVDETRKRVTLHVEASTLPNQVGSEQKRIVTSITDDELQLGNSTTFTGELINYVMKRASPVVVN
jgi:hypothetical protein